MEGNHRRPADPGRGDPVYEAGTRTRLLAAAIAVIEEDGASELRVRDIALRGGVSPASVYHFFGSRDGLITAAQAARIQGLTNRRAEVLAAAQRWTCTEDIWQDLEEIVRSAFNNSEERKKKLSTLSAALEHPELLDVLAAEQRESAEHMATVVAQAQVKGWLSREVDPYTFIVWARGTISGLLYAEIDDQVDRERWLQITLKAMRAILANPQPEGHKSFLHRFNLR